VVRLPATDSTNDVALACAADGAEEGTVVVADEQRAGRGRHGRHWHSPAGSNLYCSVVLRPTEERRRWPELSWVTAAALADALRGLGVAGLSIKYPNDVYVAGRKVAGILLETRVGPAAPAAVVAGIGVNVNLELADLPAEIAATATSLRAVLGRPVDREELLRGLCASLERHYALWRGSGPEAVRAQLARAGVGFWGNDPAAAGGALVESSAAAAEGRT
jgi:BirA family biotin operon repressor/biotin-[acetyl-CoA-carboxylase] ligase